MCRKIPIYIINRALMILNGPSKVLSKIVQVLIHVLKWYITRVLGRYLGMVFLQCSSYWTWYFILTSILLPWFAFSRFWFIAPNLRLVYFFHNEYSAGSVETDIQGVQLHSHFLTPCIGKTTIFRNLHICIVICTSLFYLLPPSL